MSQLLIRNYLNDLTRIKKVSGSLTEGVISEAFKDLLKAWAKHDGLVFISQYEFLSPHKNRIRPDGTILHDLRVPFGYWEAKDTSDDLDDEIRKKLAKGYPQDNISRRATWRGKRNASLPARAGCPNRCGCRRMTPQSSLRPCRRLKQKHCLTSSPATMGKSARQPSPRSKRFGCCSSFLRFNFTLRPGRSSDRRVFSH